MKLLTTFAFVVLCFLEVSSQAYPDRHSTSYTDGWISCQVAVNPNAKERSDSHWIMYDLGSTYALSKSTIWNVNAPNYVSDGMQDVIIDYSIDGETWIEWGNYTFPQGPVSAFYQGDEGPDFSGLIARYVLITGISNYGGTCYGLGEVKIEATNAVVSNTEETLEGVELLASPNPFSKESRISVKTDESGLYNYLVADGLGREVASGSISVSDDNGEVIFDAGTLNSGIYTFTLFKNQKAKTILLQVVK